MITEGYLVSIKNNKLNYQIYDSDGETAYYSSNLDGTSPKLLAKNNSQKEIWYFPSLKSTKYGAYTYGVKYSGLTINQIYRKKKKSSSVETLYKCTSGCRIEDGVEFGKGGIVFTVTKKKKNSGKQKLTYYMSLDGKTQVLLDKVKK
jgi:hypothetical protein